MNKTGSSVIMILAEILVVILVVVITSQAAVGFAKSDTVIKVNTANDLAMMVNTMVGTPGNGIVAFPYNVSKYTFILSSGTITVMKKGDLDVNIVVRTFNLPKGYSAEGVVEEKDRICLQKKNRKLLLRECSPNES